MGNHSSKKKIPTTLSSDELLMERKEISCSANGIQVRTSSLKSLKSLTEKLLDTDQDVAKVTLDIKEDIWKNKELYNLVEEYFDNCLKIFQFCDALQRGPIIYLKTLEELKEFKDAESPLSEELMLLSERQSQMNTKLRRHNKMMSKKYKLLHVWRRITTAIFIGACGSVIICAIVAAGLAVPPVAAALSAATTIPLGSIGKWINVMWKKYETAVKDHQEVICAMELVDGIVTKDLESIQQLMEKLKADMGEMVTMEEKREKVERLLKDEADELGKRVNECCTEVRKTKTEVLKQILQHCRSSTS